MLDYAPLLAASGLAPGKVNRDRKDDEDNRPDYEQWADGHVEVEHGGSKGIGFIRQFS